MRLSALYHRLCGGRLRHGPFRGMRYVAASVGSSYGAKLLGVYEAELRGALDSLDARGFRSIVNVGAAEGYYAVGLARRHPTALVTAFETELRGQELIRRLAALNGVSDRVRVAGTCRPEDLRACLGEGALIFMDAEGAETELLDPALVPALADCTCVVEMHDYLRPGATALLRQRFAGTHTIVEIPTRPRTTADLPLAFRLLFRLGPRGYAASVLDEGRPAPMSWLRLDPQKRPA